MNMIDEMPCGYIIILTTTAVSTAQSPLQSCTEVSATLEVSCRPAQMSQQLQNLTLLAGASENALVESESTLLSCRGLGASGCTEKHWCCQPEYLGGLRVASGPIYIFADVYTTHNEWTIIKYVMEVFRPFQYWMLWMSKRHTVTLNHIITVYNDMFDHKDGFMRELAEKITQWKEDLFFAMEFARQKWSKDYTEVTPMTGMFLISPHILDPFHK